MTEISPSSPPYPLRKPITSLRLTIGGYVLVFLLLGLFGLIVPHFAHIFRDFKTDPPAFTRLILNFSRWVVDAYGWVWLLLAPAVAPIAVTQVFWRPLTPQQSFFRTVIAALTVFGLIVLIIAGTVIALFLPMTSLIQ